MPYAEATTVPVERSRAEVERLLRKAGAKQFVSGWDDQRGMARIQCQLDGRILQFNVFMPDPGEHQVSDGGRRRKQEQIQRAMDQEERRRWRALVLIIKAKLELVQSGQSTVEREFLADILLPNQQTVGTWLGEELEKVYSSGKMPKMLLPGA